MKDMEEKTTANFELRFDERLPGESNMTANEHVGGGRSNHVAGGKSDHVGPGNNTQVSFNKLSDEDLMRNIEASLNKLGGDGGK